MSIATMMGVNLFNWRITVEQYETPIFVEEDGMNFPAEIWAEFSGGKWCFGCTNCNCN